ncbi:MAG: hypothetical protein FWH47_06150 [Methanomassiliicoccaceae archaeon]|nr:hypothetical protein [Methanomassiliicoccaceae archaeon]
MKVFSVHFVLKGKSDYKDLAPVFPEILKALLEEIGQTPEEEEILQMFIEMNMADLERNRKPEGYNRKGRMRLIFPIGRKELYLKAYNKSTDMSRMTDLISGLLNSAGVKFEVTHNDMVEFD